MTLTIKLKLDDETMGILLSISNSLRHLIGKREVARPEPVNLRSLGPVSNKGKEKRVVDESALSLNTPEFMVQEQLKDQAREQGWTPFKE